MIAGLMLSILLIGIIVYALTQYSKSRAISVPAVLVACVGLYFVWNPDQATALAKWAGVGRGVDLILYLWVAMSLILLLNLHLKLRRQLEEITSIARFVAIRDARAQEMQEPPNSGSVSQKLQSDIATTKS